MSKSEHHPRPLPALHSIAITDWLPKLGEKAFLTWLSLQSWRPISLRPDEPFCIPLSLNKVIKKLRVGKATFYEKILTPLRLYGFVELSPSVNSRDIHLIVYSYPYNHAENANLPLYPKDLHSQSRVDGSESELHGGSHLMPSSTPDPETVRGENQLGPQLEPVSSVIDIDLKDDKERIEDRNRSDLDPTIPLELRTMLESDPALLERSSQIIQVYQDCKHHRFFHIDAFLTKTKFCVQYPHDPKRFAAYLQKAMQNDLNKATTRPPSLPTRGMSFPPELPPWIARQSKQPREIDVELAANQEEERDVGISAEQKEEIERLLFALGELKPC